MCFLSYLPPVIDSKRRRLTHSSLIQFVWVIRREHLVCRLGIFLLVGAEWSHCISLIIFQVIRYLHELRISFSSHQISNQWASWRTEWKMEIRRYANQRGSGLPVLWCLTWYACIIFRLYTCDWSRTIKLPGVLHRVHLGVFVVVVKCSIDALEKRFALRRLDWLNIAFVLFFFLALLAHSIMALQLPKSLYLLTSPA